jgi:hypothetical protein
MPTNFRHGDTKVNFVKYSDGSIQTTANFNKPLLIKTVTGNYTITEADATDNWMIRIFAPINTEAFVTIPAYQLGIFDVPDGSSFIISSAGLGKVTFQTGFANINYPIEGRSIERKYGRVIVTKTSQNAWDFDGQLGV